MVDISAAVGGPATSDPKVPQRQVNYRQAEQGQSCGNCIFFEGPDQCRLVQGPVSSTGLSDLWQSVEAVEDSLFTGQTVPPGGPQV